MRSEVVTEIAERPVTLVPKTEPREYEIVYRNLITFGYWHLAAIYGLYLCLTEAQWTTIVLNSVLFVLAEIGITAGSHRLWTHKTYKAKLPLEILLMLMNSIAFQNTVSDWVRDHRLHHKYSDTDADPHNASRGFFYSHVGWLLVRKHPEVKKRGKSIEMNDIYNNPVLKFQKRFAIPLLGIMCFGLPTLIPVYCWGESWSNAWHLNLLRYVLNLNVTFTVNSVAHIWGNKPYNKFILPVQNKMVSFVTFGEGFHNFHHVFPWDYRTSELGNNYLNLTTKFIDFFAIIGWAYDLKTVSPEVIQQRAQRTGDGTNLWGSLDNNLKNVFIVEAHKPQEDLYRAFCAGSIIGEDKVISSANCFLTNQKSDRHDYNKIDVVAGSIHVLIKKNTSSISTQQWRSIVKVYSQRFFRFPAYNLGVLIVNEPWIFNNFVNKIPYESQDHDFDGVCTATGVKATKSWSYNKYLFTAEVDMIRRGDCERILLRSCRHYFCTAYDPSSKCTSSEAEGSGLICRETGDPMENDTSQGILVGVTSIVNSGLPNLHMRVGAHYKWVTDQSSKLIYDKVFISCEIILFAIRTYFMVT